MSRWLTIKTLPMDYEKTDKAGTWIGWGKWREKVNGLNALMLCG